MNKSEDSRAGKGSISVAELEILKAVRIQCSVTMTRFTPSATLTVDSSTYRTPEQWLDRLDPEWAKIWNIHGAHHCQAEEVSIEEVRRNPTAYSFTYPTWEGNYGCPAVYNVITEESAGPRVHLEEEFHISVTNPAGQIKIRVYTPEGSGPFPVHFNYHGGNSTPSWNQDILLSLG
jgi:hypothetical protein